MDLNSKYMKPSCRSKYGFIAIRFLPVNFSKINTIMSGSAMGPFFILNMVHFKGGGVDIVFCMFQDFISSIF